MVMQIIGTFNLMDKNAAFDSIVKTLLAMAFVSIIMSVILVFGYLKASFRED
jgi:hypothetical protein